MIIFERKNLVCGNTTLLRQGRAREKKEEEIIMKNPEAKIQIINVSRRMEAKLVVKLNRNAIVSVPVTKHTEIPKMDTMAELEEYFIKMRDATKDSDMRKAYERSQMVAKWAEHCRGKLVSCKNKNEMVIEFEIVFPNGSGNFNEFCTDFNGCVNQKI